MRLSRLIPAFIAVLFLCAGCGPRKTAITLPADAGETAGTVEIVRGFAIYGHEVRAFLLCNTDEEVWAIDESGLLWDVYQGLALDSGPYAQIFVIAEGKLGPPPREGFGAGYAGALEVAKVLYMASEGFRCDLDLGEFAYRAYGNEPFWSVRVSDGEITLMIPGRDGRTWSGVEERRTTGGVLYAAADASGGIEVRIIEAPCRDTMSGAYFAYSASVSTGGLELAGCALKGTGPSLKP